MVIDKKQMLDIILMNQSLENALSASKVYVYGISGADTWTLLDVEEACVSPWDNSYPMISSNYTKVRVIYKVLAKEFGTIEKYFNGQTYKYEPYLYFSYGCGCFPTRDECLKYGNPFVNESHLMDGMDGIPFDISSEITKIRNMFPEKLGYVNNHKLEFRTLYNINLWVLTNNEVMRVIHPYYIDNKLEIGRVKMIVLDNNLNSDRLEYAYPKGIFSSYNHFAVTRRLLSVNDISVSFDIKNEWGDYQGPGDSITINVKADELWRSVYEYEENNKERRADYRSRQKFID